MFLVKFVLPILVIVGFGWLIWWAYLRLVKIYRDDKYEKLRVAQEEIESTLSVAAVAKEVTEEDEEALAKARAKIRDRIELGEDAKL